MYCALWSKHANVQFTVSFQSFLIVFYRSQESAKQETWIEKEKTKEKKPSFAPKKKVQIAEEETELVHKKVNRVSSGPKPTVVAKPVVDEKKESKRKQIEEQEIARAKKAESDK